MSRLYDGGFRPPVNRRRRDGGQLIVLILAGLIIIGVFFSIFITTFIVLPRI